MSLRIDAHFPGGNIVVERTEGETIYLKPDLRDTLGHWFYWYFRVAGAGGRTLTFVFDERDMGVLGPGVSLDGGKTWNWLGAAAVAGGIFSYSFPVGAEEVRFSVGMPYLRSDFDRFLARYRENPFIEPGVLTTTPKSREVVMIRVREKGKTAPYAVAVTSRHHCCEMMGTRVLEGLLEGVLADDETGQWLRENVEFLFVPFMDTDGVEEGDQGKNRAPYDHNRDYAKPPIYREVAAWKEKLPAWADGRPLVFLDLHDPALKGPVHESLHFLEPEERGQAAPWRRFTALLERHRKGPIPYSQQNDLLFGCGYNTNGQKPPALSAGWAWTLPNTLLAFAAEIPYANASGSEVNVPSARALGRDFAVTLKEFLRDHKS